MDNHSGKHATSTDTLTVSCHLYNRTSVFIATLLGSVLAGGVLMAWNYQRTGQPTQAKKAWLYGFCGLLATCIASLYIPANIPGPAIVVPLAFAMSVIHQHVQGDMLKRHLHHGGQLASKWRAAGVGCMTMLAIMLVLMMIYSVVR
ncbi:hypothetical protein HA48_00650 [Pantoea wallisii]|uniref:Uncharacterized protein n=1 Tax=Pantoea wallisii TaxID=1076551 RepID=A0A1X1DEE3_9GAMM|nr:hypothetical protein [Pantoea wallisii]ORM75008.1 hypothetical protein HA48_00650 [Pantoea wallisii]